MIKNTIFIAILFLGVCIPARSLFCEESNPTPSRRLMDEVYSVDSSDLNPSESLERISGDIDTSFYTGVSMDSTVNRALSGMLGSSSDSEISTGY